MSSRARAVMGAVLLALLALASGVCASHVHLDLGNEAHHRSVACSGMWSGRETSILLTAQGTPATPVSTVFFEWTDFPYLGVEAHANTQYGYHTKTYVCTSQTVDARLCTADQMGMWFGDPKGVKTSIEQSFLVFSPSQTVHTVKYDVKKTGYYCAAAVQLLNASALAPGVAHENARVDLQFVNKFKGDLPASERPRLTFAMALAIVYIALTVAWAGICYVNRHQLLPTQYFILASFALALVDATSQWVKYSYMNGHAVEYSTMRSWNGNRFMTGFIRFCIVGSSLLSAMRDTGCLLLLVLVAKGFGVIRHALGALSLPLAVLALANFVFEALYFSSRPWSARAGFGATMVVLGLAFTLTTLYAQVIVSLSRMVSSLTFRRQPYKASLFLAQRRITVLASSLAAAWAFLAFFFCAKRSTEDEPRVWRARWLNWSGWMELILLLLMVGTAFVWRPSAHNLRVTTADEVAPDDYAEEEDFELGDRDNDGGTARGPPAGYTPPVASPSDVIFAIDGEDEEQRHAARERSRQVEGAPPGSEERRALITSDDNE